MVLLHELDVHYCDPLTAHMPLEGLDHVAGDERRGNRYLGKGPTGSPSRALIASRLVVAFPLHQACFGQCRPLPANSPTPGEM